MTVYLRDKKSNDALTRVNKHWGLGGMASFTARIVSLAPGYDHSSKSPTISYRENVSYHFWQKLNDLNNETKDHIFNFNKSFITFENIYPRGKFQF